jgi:DNA repair exonuclease SbcCD nuclease subunit
MKKYTALLISDIHFSNRLPGAKPGENGVTDRLADQLAMLGRVRQTAIDKNVDGVFILGDLFDQSRVDPITLTEAVRAIAAFEKPVRILPGNHDAVNTKGSRFAVEAFGVMGNPNIRYMKTGVAVRPFANKATGDKGWLTFHPVGYSSQEEAEKSIAAAGLRAARAGCEVLLMHHSIMGSKHGDWVCDDGLDPAFVCERFSWVFSGHFHTSAYFGPKSNGMYLGAPLHLRIEDEGRDACYHVVTFYEDGTRSYESIDGGCPKFHTLQFPVGADESKLGIVGLKKQDYIRIVCVATQTEWALAKPRIVECEEILTGRGFRVSHQHKPVYHHAVRSVDATTGEPLIAAAANPESAIAAYVDSESVDTNGLDKKILQRIGREALEAARGAA